MTHFFLTFCLILFFSAVSHAGNADFKSVHLQSFYNNAVTVDTVRLNGVAYCELTHQDVSLVKPSKRVMTRYNVDSLDHVSSDDVKEILIRKENADLSFWIQNNVTFDESKLNTLEDMINSNIFNNLSGVVDNIYCFPYLGARYENDQNRQLVVKSLNGIEPNVKAFVYYDDGYYSKTSSVLIVYLLDSEKNEVYALRGIIK